MIKQIFVLAHFLFLFLFEIFFGENVKVSLNLPDKAAINQEINVTITITKGNLSGFAKVQSDLPDGFNCEPVDTKGATFSFKDNKVKFIWMALPSEETFDISYKLTYKGTTPGNFEIGGKFSFIENNERASVDIPVHNLQIVSEDVVVENNTASNTESSSSSTEETTSTSNQNETPQTTAAEEVKVSVVRSVTQVDDAYKVVLTIEQENLSGFAKLEDLIPNGFVAIEDNASGGIFSFKDNKAKFLWMSVPTTNPLTVSYILKPDNDLDGIYKINGEFSYLAGEDSKTLTIEPSELKYVAPQEEVVVENTENNNPDNTEVVNESTTNNEEVVENTSEEPVNTSNERTIAEDTGVKEQPVNNNESSTENEVENVTSTPSPSNGVDYKVQIAAGHQTVPSNYFKNKFNVTDKVSVELHDGWKKYVVGKYKTYKEARDKRNNIWNTTKIKTAFVTAYNNGQRITVQEALMITNQKWIK
ncbi:MAG: hypothetical protein Kow0079_14070 [Vicingaceae bacterium]